MSPSQSYLLLLALVALVGFQCQRNFIRGLSTGLFLCVFASTHLRILTPGLLPELTLHRAILLCLLVFWSRQPGTVARVRRIPLGRQLLLWALITAVSLPTTEHLAFSVKRYLDFILETCLFYVIVATTVREPRDALQLLRAAWLGLVLVGAVAVVERYTGFNPADRFLPLYTRGEEGALRDVLSTYPHRILLGAGMAMGVPLGMAMLFHPRLHRPPVLLAAGSIGLFAASCYFADSRGPWLACAVGLMLMGVLGSSSLRRVLVVVGVASMLVLMMRPGVLSSLEVRTSNTLDTDSFKGGTFRYRIELWKIAYTEISGSPWRFLVGHGPGSGRAADIEWELSYRDTARQITSWDNHFAYILYQHGFVGLGAAFWLHGSILLLVYRRWQRMRPPGQDLMACLLSAIVLMPFMMTNVLIFAKQLDYLFWSLIPVALCVGAPAVPRNKSTPVPDPPGEVTLTGAPVSHEVFP